MGRRLLLALFSVLLVSVTVYAVLNDSDESDAATADDVRVFIERADGTYAETVVSGISVKQIIERASNNLGMPIIYDDLERISFVGGYAAPSGTYWNIHQWMPLGTHDWASVGFDSKSDTQLISGTSYCLHYSEQKRVSGGNVYETPDFEPESDGYVFIRFDYMYDYPSAEIQSAFTTEDRINGFWIKGHGSNMGEVVKDAMESNGFEAEFLIKKDSNGNDLQYWILSFFGIGDTNLGGGNNWAYWSQFVYVDDGWGYNSLTLGYYDPGVYKYASVIYIISLNYGQGGGEEQNVLHTLPEVYSSSYVDALVKTRMLDVTFRLDGKEFCKTQVAYGHTLDEVPEVPEKEGYVFSGWGNTTVPITTNRIFSGRYISLSGEPHTVKYLDSHGVVIFTELVEDGESATFSETPCKESTAAEEYSFLYWSTDGSSKACLEEVNSDLVLRPVFKSTPKTYTVSFLLGDGTLFAERQVRYGEGVPDIPIGPVREETVDKVYFFEGWYVTVYSGAKEDDTLLADLSNITSSKVVFAAYTYKPHPYGLTVHIVGHDDLSFDVVYGGFLTEDMMTSSIEGNLLRFYRDSSMTQEVGTSFMFSGDTTLYAKTVPGTYRYGDESKTSVIVTMDITDIPGLEHVGNDYTVADISGFADGKSVLLGRSEISKLGSVLGDDFYIGIELHRGRISVNLGDLVAALGLRSGVLNGISDDSVEFSIGKGPTSSVRINSSLKNVNWDNSYTVTMKINGKSVTDPAAQNIRVKVTVPYEYDEAVSPMVWSANPNTGVLTSVPCAYSEGTVTFEASSLLYYFTGTSGPRSSQTDDRDYCPYGSVDYTTDGATEDTYNSTLNRMDIDCYGNILMIPSSLEGYALWTVGPDAFSGIRNVSALVVPPSVKVFDWTSLYDIQVSEVFFLGDAPSFIDEPPAHVTVYYSDKAEGWTSYPYGVLNILTYSMNGFSLQYCLVDDQIIITKWVKGSEVDIPAFVSVNGTDYPVTVIGDNAFEGSTVKYVRIPDTIREIQTRAFYHCSSLEQVTWGSSPSVKVLADECFRGCLVLRSTTMIIPDGTRFIGFETFRDCQMLKSVNIPNSVRDIRGGAFYNCSALADLTLSNNLSVIPERCFGYCNDLAGVILPDSVKILEHDAFYRCDVLADINLNLVEIVGNNVFYDCQNLTSVTLGSALTSLGTDCFGHNLMLVEIIAYCVQPHGYDGCGLTSDSVLYTNYDVADGWTAEHQVIEKEDDLKRSFEAESMPYVLGTIVIVLTILALASIIYRRRCLL